LLPVKVFCNDQLKTPLAGIYLHIPFCKQACHYCNFHFTTSLRNKEAMVSAILMEMNLRAAFIGEEPVETIYFGGGTPSLLESHEILRLTKAIQNNFRVLPGAEITIETNPDDINAEKLSAWKTAGINRLSIGIQSFHEEELLWMNRAHDANQARQCIELAQAAGFENITIDLIYGSPLLSDEKWKENVDIATGYGIPHLSCYALTVEEKTPLHKNIARNISQPVDDEKQARQFILLMQWLRDKGYLHYEVSNFAKPGFESRHNSAYWQGKKYLGLGPSAHSFDGKERSWNVANNAVYIRDINDDKLPLEKELLTEDQLVNENIMISLRTMQGLDLQKLESQWGTSEKKRIVSLLPKFTSTNLIKIEKDFVKLTDEGMLRADGIASGLFR
jgi:oxygen-independent coproporphyrinogen-3 oxidase